MRHTFAITIDQSRVSDVNSGFTGGDPNDVTRLEQGLNTRELIHGDELERARVYVFFKLFDLRNQLRMRSELAVILGFLRHDANLLCERRRAGKFRSEN